MSSLFNATLNNEQIVEKILALPQAERSQVIEQLKSAAISKMTAQAKVENRKKVLAKICAARDDVNGGSNGLRLIDGALRRATVEPLESLAVKEPVEISKILAGADKLSVTDRTMIKSVLFRVGAIPA